METHSHTSTGHIDGMLDRDLRTAKLPFVSDLVLVSRGSRSDIDIDIDTRSVDWTVPKQNVSHHHRHQSLPRRTSPHSPSESRKSRNSWKSRQSLRVLIVALIYISSLVIPTTLAAPVLSRKVRMARSEQRPNWVNPCGFLDEPDEASQGSVMSDAELLQHIVDQAKIAAHNAKQVVKEYVQKTFQMEPEELQESRRKWRYEWLPNREQVPKELGEPVPQEHLQTLTIEQALLDTYEDLQRIAVGIEQIVWDQEDNNGEFLNAFRETGRKLKQVLCEIQTTLREKGISLRSDITREIMSEGDRKLENSTDINNRNWVILRDYMNTLEYIIDVFTHLGTK